MDALAAQGVRFDCAYATAPVCSASRSAIITGVSNEATGLGHHRSRHPIPQDVIRGIPTYLREAGYFTSNHSKTDYNMTENQEFIARCWDESSSQVHWKNRQAGQPFFSVFNFLDSQQSRTMTQTWGWYEDHVLKNLSPDEIISEKEVILPEFYLESKSMKHHVSRVYNSLLLTDKQIGKHIDEIKDAGLFEDTIIFCFSDHGEGITRGKCNAIGFGYRATFIVYIPQKYAHLSPWGSGFITDELVSFEDLAPTILNLAGVDIPEVMTGRALMGSRRKPEPEFIYAARNRLDETPDLCRSAISKDYVYTRIYWPHYPSLKLQKYSDVGEIQQQIRRDYAQGKLNDQQSEMLEEVRPLEYFYKISDDTWEVDNLVEHPDYQDVLQAHRKAVKEHIIEIADVAFLHETDIHEKVPNSPYEDRFDKDYNPIEKMLEVAELIDTTAESIEKLIPYIDSPIPQVRYWASIGLYAARQYITEQHRDLEKFLNGELTQQIELAGALYAAFGLKEAKEILIQALYHDTALYGHQALHKIIYDVKIAPDFIEELKSVSKMLLEKK